MGREQVLNNKRKRNEEENRRMLESRRKVNEDPQKLLKAHLPQEAESIGEGGVVAVAAGLLFCLI